MSERQATTFRRSRLNEDLVTLCQYLNKESISYSVDIITFERKGEFTAAGKPKTYIPDLVLEKKIIIEVEGKGSASADNEKRDAFFMGLGYWVFHVSNQAVRREGKTVAKMIKQLIGIRKLTESIQEILTLL